MSGRLPNELDLQSTRYQRDSSTRKTGEKTGSGATLFLTPASLWSMVSGGIVAPGTRSTEHGTRSGARSMEEPAVQGCIQS